jgi:chromosome segregation ATPase
MPEENENGRVDDFISLWKKKIATENKESIIGDSLDKVEALQKENNELRKKISDNIDLITKSEEILKNIVNEKEKLNIEKEEAIAEFSIKNQQLEKENSELNLKVKSMIKLLLEKDEEIKAKSNIILQLQTASSTPSIQSPINDSLLEELQTENSKKKKLIEELEIKVKELAQENKDLNNQLVADLKTHPVDYTLPTTPKQTSVSKPLSQTSSNLPLEALCQDLQSDLNKYKRIVEKLKEEKSQLKNSLENQGITLSISDIDKLKNENESLKNDISKLQKTLETKEIEVTQAAMRQVENRITNLQLKLKEKEDLIADLKLMSGPQSSAPSGPMTGLIEDLQNNINKLKLNLAEKDKEIDRLTNLVNS